jgi:hypothetical protein
VPPLKVCFQPFKAVEFRSLFIAASESPFQEPTTPNPTLTKYAGTTESLHTYGAYLMQCLPKFIQQISVLKDELTLYTAPSGIIPVLTFLRDHSRCQFKTLVDISGVDYPERPKRFEVVYHLLSLRFGARIRVKTYTNEVDAVPSATDVYSGANWFVDLSLAARMCRMTRSGMNERHGTCSEYFSKTTQTCMCMSLLSLPNG